MSAGKPAPRAGLGRGLASLLGEDYASAAPEAASRTRLPLAAIRPSAFNPRKSFDPAALDELAQSIVARGLVQPIVVRAMGPDAYEIVAGERRYRAAGIAGLEDVPVVVIEADDAAALEIAIIENVQRSDLNVVEEARGYVELIERFGYAQSELAGTLSKSRSHVANTMRLLRLPDTVLDRLAAGRLTAGQARPLIGRDDAEALAARIEEQGLSAREIERLVQAPGKEAATPVAKPTDARIADWQSRLEKHLGFDVRVMAKGGTGGQGGVTITLKDGDALEHLIAHLGENDAKNDH